MKKIVISLVLFVCMTVVFMLSVMHTYPLIKNENAIKISKSAEQYLHMVNKQDYEKRLKKNQESYQIRQENLFNALIEKDTDKSGLKIEKQIYEKNLRKAVSIVPQIDDKNIKALVDLSVEEIIKDFLENKTNYKIKKNEYLVLDANVTSHKNNTISYILVQQYLFEGKNKAAFISSCNYNFDLKKELILKDVFLPHTRYLDILSEICFDTLKKQTAGTCLYNEDLIKIITEPREENFENFSLGENDLRIYFKIAKDGQNKFSNATVNIPLEKIAEFIRLKDGKFAPGSIISSDKFKVTSKAGSMVPNDFKPNGKKIALTFDDGPSTVNTLYLLDILNAYNAKATFFVCGYQIEGKEDILSEAIKYGNVIGNHTWNHSDLKKLKKEEVDSQIDNTNTAIAAATGGYQCKYLRPPYGSFEKGVKEYNGMRIVYWNIDTLDWKNKDADKIAKYISDTIKDGDMVLMHDLYKTSVDAAVKVLEELTKKGWEFVTVEEVLK